MKTLQFYICEVYKINLDSPLLSKYVQSLGGSKTLAHLDNTLMFVRTDVVRYLCMSELKDLQGICLEETMLTCFKEYVAYGNNLAYLFKANRK